MNGSSCPLVVAQLLRECTMVCEWSSWVWIHNVAKKKKKKSFWLKWVVTKSPFLGLKSRLQILSGWSPDLASLTLIMVYARHTCSHGPMHMHGYESGSSAAWMEEKLSAVTQVGSISLIPNLWVTISLFIDVGSNFTPTKVGRTVRLLAIHPSGLMRAPQIYFLPMLASDYIPLYIYIYFFE